MPTTKFLLNTDQNIQKQFINTQVAVSVPGSYSYVDHEITHNFGYIPSARVWYEPIDGQWYPLALTQLQQGTSDSLKFVGTFTLSTTKLTVSLVNFSGTTKSINILARIYYDD